MKLSKARVDPAWVVLTLFLFPIAAVGQLQGGPEEILVVEDRRVDRVQGHSTEAPAGMIRVFASGGIADPGAEHPFGGIMVHVSGHRMGLHAQGQFGDGGAYASLLGSGGVSVRLAGAHALRVDLLASGGLYRETVGDGVVRQLPVYGAGVFVTFGIGSLDFGVAPQLFLGSYSEESWPSSVALRMVRVPIVLGWARR
jgi:hypothetical protein